MNSCPCQVGQTITPKGWQDTHPYAQDRPGPSSSPRRTHTPLHRAAAGTLQRKERRSPEPAQPICVPQTPPSRPRQAPGLRQQIFLASCSLSRSRRHRSPVPQPPRRSPVRRETWAEAAPSPHPPGQPVAPAGKGTGVRPLRSFLPPVLPARTSAARRTELPPAASARPGPALPGPAAPSRGAVGRRRCGGGHGSSDTAAGAFWEGVPHVATSERRWCRLRPSPPPRRYSLRSQSMCSAQQAEVFRKALGYLGVCVFILFCLFVYLLSFLSSLPFLPPISF